MAQRTQIGLIFSYDPEWVAGSYYILNLVQALKVQDDHLKPFLHILCYSEQEFKIVKDTGYEYLEFHLLDRKDFWGKYNMAERMINKISRVTIGRNIVPRKPTRKRLTANIDLLFPASDNPFFSNVKHSLFWIPDFQEHFLPAFFSSREVSARKYLQRKLVENRAPVVLSSHDSEKHFRQLYPTAMNPVYILPFAVTHPRFDHVLLKDIQVKYHVDRPYFFCPNQVWAHKNHLLVLKAVKLLAEAESDVLVLFSGKEKDHRNPALFGDLQKFIKENNLSSHVRFLGFIDRTDQLALMRYARCVIQPSLFEGWSTVVEDAKAMGQYILASNLPVHREQLKENVTFFDPADPAGLMELMKNYSGEQRRPPSHDYRENIVEFGADFLRIVASLMQ